MRDNNILLVDIGNTSICVGLGNGKSVSISIRVPTAGCSRLSAKKAISHAVRNKAIAGGVLSSVVPALTQLWRSEMAHAANKTPIVVSHRLNLGVHIDYPKPSTVGHDRLVNVCGAVERWGFPLLVADFGTASTFDVVNKRGSFVGGVIAPGLKLMAESMAKGTALLPRIEIKGKCPAIGRSTEQAMKIGTIIGYHGLVREIVSHLVRLNGLGRIKLIATGGLADIALKGSDLAFTIDHSLTLRGLYRIFKLNHNATGG